MHRSYLFLIGEQFLLLYEWSMENVFEEGVGENVFFIFFTKRPRPELFFSLFGVENVTAQLNYRADDFT